MASTVRLLPHGPDLVDQPGRGEDQSMVGPGAIGSGPRTAVEARVAQESVPRGAVSGFSGGRRKGLALKTGALHAEAVRCAFSVSLDVKTQIAVHWSPPSRQRLVGQDYARAAQVSGHSSDGSSGMLAGVGLFAT